MRHSTATSPTWRWMPCGRTVHGQSQERVLAAYEWSEADMATWQVYWTTGPQGKASWSRVADELKVRGYAGVVCLTAEYSDEEAVDQLVARDIAFAKGLFA